MARAARVPAHCGAFPSRGIRKRGPMKTRTALATWMAAALILSAAPAWSLDTPGDPAISAKDPEGVALPSRGKRKKKEEPAKQGQGPQQGPKKDEPAFEEAVKDFQKIDGLFTLWKKDDRYLMELKPDQMDKPYMLSVTRETGIGQGFLLAAQVLGENPVEFHKAGKKVQLLLKNPRFQAMTDADVKRAVDKSFSDSLAGAAKIESQPHPESKAILVDITPFFLTDVEGVGPFLGQVLQTPYNMDRENSYVSEAKVFQMNV